MVFGPFPASEKGNREPIVLWKFYLGPMLRLRNSPTLDLFIEAMRIPPRLYRDYPEHWIRFCGEQSLPRSPCLDSLQNFGDGFHAPHEDLSYGCTRPRILLARTFIIPRILTRSRQRNRRKRGSRRSLNHLLWFYCGWYFEPCLDPRTIRNESCQAAVNIKDAIKLLKLAPPV